MRRAFIHLAVVVTLLTGTSSAAIRGDEPSLTETIDRWIDERLDRERLQRAPAADDAVFLRRIHLDLHEVVPSQERTVRFLNSDDPQKRSQLVDELLASPRFGEYFGEIWRNRLLSPIERTQRAKSDRQLAPLMEHAAVLRGMSTVESDHELAT
ncbi:MAG: DUF1549 domain-containing protein [Planctomycetaceae bacterium]|nr:DUF1549 domain-containing protein [Planctomycetaceae bacterium]